MAGEDDRGRSAPSTSRITLMGLGIDPLTEAGAIEIILGDVVQGRGGWVVTPNLDILRQAAHDPDLRALVQAANLVLADGMPLVWASRVQGEPLPDRVAGATLTWTLAQGAAKSGASIFLLGGNPGVAERAGAVLAGSIEGLDVRGHHFPPWGFELSEKEMATIVDELAKARPDIVFCGLGFPKQERLMARLAPLFPHSWFVGVGASLSFVAGEFPRAPLWMQRTGLEWVHRLGHEPRRLLRRYLVDDLPFVPSLFLDAAKRRGERRRQQIRP